MIDIIVRSKRDADAVKAMLRVFYDNWRINVHTLHGARRLDKALSELEDIVTSDKFYVLLLGREDKELARELDKHTPMNVSVHVVPRAKIRNTRIEHLSNEFNMARSKLRLAVTWSEKYESYVFGLRQGKALEEFEYNPAYDVFMGIGNGFYKALTRVFRKRICYNPVLVRKFGGLHDVYCGYKKIALLEIPDEGFRPTGKVIEEFHGNGINLDKIIEANKHVIELYERISMKFLQQFRDWADTVIVPWSGGKDSTATLILVLKVFPKDKVKVVFSDTGTEFPWTIEYIDVVSKKLGIKVNRVYAGVDKGLLSEGKPMPTHDNRWCTERKIAGVMNAIARLAEGNTIIVTGDRDAESKRRSARPPIRVIDENTLMLAPIKMWSAAHVQLYILYNNIELNPLYEKGFYRIGCYMCPALRSWELFVMNTDLSIALRLQKYLIYREFIKYRLYAKNKDIKAAEESYCDMLSICG